MTLAYPSSLNVNRPAQPFHGVAGVPEREAARACIRLDQHFMVARCHAAALVLARRVGDEVVKATAAARLRRTLLRAIGIIHAAATVDAEMHAILVATFNESTPAMCELLQAAFEGFPYGDPTDPGDGLDVGVAWRRGSSPPRQGRP